MLSFNVYQNTVERLEPEIAMIDPGAFYASAAISLKRMADALEAKNKLLESYINSKEGSI